MAGFLDSPKRACNGAFSFGGALSFPDPEASVKGFEMVCLQHLPTLGSRGQLLDLGCLSSPPPATFSANLRGTTSVQKHLSQIQIRQLSKERPQGHQRAVGTSGLRRMCTACYRAGETQSCRMHQDCGLQSQVEEQETATLVSQGLFCRKCRLLSFLGQISVMWFICKHLYCSPWIA